jgi:hypothetical protein
VATDPDGSPELDAREPVVSPIRGVAAGLDETGERPVVLVFAPRSSDGSDATGSAALATSLARVAEVAGAEVIDASSAPDAPDPIDDAAERAGAQPVVVVVAGGDDAAAPAIVRAAGRGWTVVPVAGTGGLAAELATRLAKRGRRRVGRRRSRPGTTEMDPVDVILEHRVLPPLVPGNEMVKRVAWELHDVPVVKLTWARLASYDVTANRLHRNAERIERSILLFGIAVTFVALLQNELSIHNVNGWWDHVFHWSLIVVPVLVSILIAMSASMAISKRWVLLRSAAESIRREIFGWRTRTGAYREDSKDPGAHRSSVEHLVERVCAIEGRLMKTEVGSSTLADVGDGPHVSLAGAHDEDDGVSRLGPEGYFRLRIEHQLDYYRSKVRRLARRLRALQVVSILAGAAGSILAITGNEVWIGLSTAVAAAVVAHIGRAQIDTTLSSYNYAIASLEECRSRWLAVPPAERDDEHFERLVLRAERTFEQEQASWRRHMSDALDVPQHE